MIKQRMNLKRALSVGLLVGCACARAEGPRSIEPMEWLNRMVQSAQVMNYGGVYTFAHDGKIETSRITHVNDAEGERGKLEFLDGPPREIVRENNQISCYYPENRLVKVDRSDGRHFFPGLISGTSSQLKEFYVVSVAGTDRVAGRECRVVRLEPKDGYRFAYRLCADTQSGLMLRAATEDDHRTVLQQFAFTEFQMDNADASHVKPSWSASGWVWDKSGLQHENADNGVTVSGAPAGFKKIAEVRRGADGRSSPMVHMVYSDGLSSVSVFIEPARSGGANPVESRRGALSFYSWRAGEQQITAVGEVPPQTVAQFARSVSVAPKSHP